MKLGTNKVNLGLRAYEGQELYYRETIEIKNLIETLKLVKPIDNLNTNKILELESIYSSEVEGYFTTRRNLSSFINKEREPNTKDERAVYSNYLALEYGAQNLGSLFTKEFIYKINSIILDEIVTGFRNEDVDIVNKRGDVVHQGLPCEVLEDYIDKLLGFCNGSSLDPLVISIVLHFYFVYIHPFTDGNGRTGRALSYLYLILKGEENYNLFSISYMLPEKRKEYYKHLSNIESNGYDLTDFVVFMLNIMIEGLSDIEDSYGFINLVNNVKDLYRLYKIEYNDMTQMMLQFLYTKDNFSIDNFYKKTRSKFIRVGYPSETLKEDMKQTLDNLMKYQVIDKNLKINDKLITR